MPTAEHNVKFNGATCDSCLNTWRWSKNMRKKLEAGQAHPSVEEQLGEQDPRAKRLDYIFFGAEDVDWKVAAARVGMLDRHPELGCTLSDHFSVEATLERDDSEYQNSNGATNGYAKPTPPSPTNYLPIETYDEVLAMIHRYTLRERSQRRIGLAHFLSEIAISIGCLVAVWWSPHNYVSFILMLVSTFGLSAGVVHGLIGGLFVGGEIRRLKEFEWEIRNARDLAESAGGKTLDRERLVQREKEGRRSVEDA